MRQALDRIEDEAHAAVLSGASILVLSDLLADIDHPPVPSLLALRAVITRLNLDGLRLRASVVVATGEARTTHHIAALISFGAAAVCPAMAFELAQSAQHRSLVGLSAQQRTGDLRQALESGLLKIMSKMGISVVRSYQSTKLFTPIGVGNELIARYFPGLRSVIGGVGLEQVAADVLRWTSPAADQTADGLQHARLLREDPSGREGEHHSMTAARARSLHKVLDGDGEGGGSWQDFLAGGGCRRTRDPPELARGRSCTSVAAAGSGRAGRGHHPTLLFWRHELRSHQRRVPAGPHLGHGSGGRPQQQWRGRREPLAAVIRAATPINRTKYARPEGAEGARAHKARGGGAR